MQTPLGTGAMGPIRGQGKAGQVFSQDYFGNEKKVHTER